MGLRRGFSIWVAGIALACSGGQGADTPGEGRPLIEGLGGYTMPITTSSPLAQKYFDQGLRLMYGFNHPEAIRAFEVAGQIDPGCAMCSWGVALALGPNINAPMDPADEARAVSLVQRALALRGTVCPRVTLIVLRRTVPKRPEPNNKKLPRRPRLRFSARIVLRLWLNRACLRET